MRYMLLIYTDPELWEREVGEQNLPRQHAEYGAYTEDLVKRGLFRSGDALQNASTATTVRIRNGQRLVTDGPFTETKEVLGGFYVIEARDLDEAIDIAARCPGARSGSMEVRPIWETAGQLNEQAREAQTTAAGG
jgi:hypothetical protein